MTKALLITAFSCVTAAAQTADAVWVPGSTQKVCQLAGELDYETKQPTASRTESNYGLAGSDLGYAFEHKGKLWLLFGDTIATPTYGGRPNAQNAAPRTPAHNDSVGFSVGTNVDQCLKLDFVRNSTGGYRNPVPVNAQGAPAFTLASFEIPVAGIDVSGRMFVIFATEKNETFATRSAMAVSDDEGNTFRVLYNFSTPPCVRCDGAKFVNVAIGDAASSSLKDGYLYFWGTQGGAGYRHSPVYLARKLAATMGQAGGIQYFTGLSRPADTPAWSAAESDATRLFQDVDGADATPTNCTGELGVDYNAFLQRWVMLYNCTNRTPASGPGIFMRFATQPWGPWSAPQLIFNGRRDRGECFFLHRAVTANVPPCDEVGNVGREDEPGGAYGPYFLSRFNTLNTAAGTTTFYYVLSTWNPYTEVIMKTTVQVAGQAVPVAGQAVPVIGLVANAAGEKATIAPNTWIEIKGLNLAKPGTERIWQGADFVSNRMPVQLDGVSVSVNGKAAFVFYISPTQVNVLTPPDPISGPVEVVLTYIGLRASYRAQAQTTSPSLFVLDPMGNVAATHQNGGLIGPLALFPGLSTPARPGENIALYANGFGVTTVPAVSGSVTQSGVLSPLPTVQIGGVAASVTFAGLVNVGQYQFNVVVPPSTGSGNHKVTATLNGLTSQGNASIFVQR